MKINSVTSYSNKTYSPNFKSITVVPYPEYKDAYKNRDYGSSLVNGIANKLAQMFNPEVRQAANDIKGEINGIFNEDNKTQGKKQLSYYA